MGKKLKLIEILATGCVLVVLIVLLVPLFYFMGWLSGWIAMVTIGDTLVNGLNNVFGSSFTKEMLPQLGGVLSWVGGFFKSFAIEKEK